MFNLYFAGSHIAESNKLIIENCGNRLYSQVHDRRNIENWIEQCNNKKSKLFVDSGAYTAFTKGIEIDIDEYIGYLNSVSKNAYVFASLDKIPEKCTSKDCMDAAQESWENYLYMLQRLNEPEKLLPVFHINEPSIFLEKILETKFDGKYPSILGLGGIAKKPRNERIQWLDEVFYIIRKSKNPYINVHGFGMTSLKLLQMYPFYSADSTSWIMTTANGGIFTQFGTVLVSSQKIKEENHVLNFRENRKRDIEKYIEDRGFTLKELSEDYKKRAEFNILYTINWCKNYNFIGKSLRGRRLF
jgi:hypothetical protein